MKIRHGAVLYVGTGVSEHMASNFRVQYGGNTYQTTQFRN
jgi:hypothetical protein